MNREEFLSACGKCEDNYRVPVFDFYRNYADVVEKIYDKYALLDGENQNKMLVERLKNWLEQRAYSDIVSTINTLNDNSEQKVLGFIHLYDYILKSTDDDYELIDQLFFIPDRFEREFQRNMTAVTEKENNFCCMQASIYHSVVAQDWMCNTGRMHWY